MVQSFTAKQIGGGSSSSQRRKVLVTGAAGNIGSYFAEHSRKKYEFRLMVRPSDDSSAIEKFGEVVRAELADLERLKELCGGMDTVVHLAANPSPNTEWPSALNDNIIGTYNTFVAAKSANCRRVIYASSIHAVSGYPSDVQVKTSEPVNPGDLYGVTKCFGEALARYMAEQEGLSAIALRIGAFQPLENAKKETGIQMMDAFVSKRDLNQLIEKCIDAENITFAILHGLSNNRFKRLDISDARELVGYEPQDDLTEINPEIKKLNLRKRVGHHNVKDKQQKSGVREDVRGSKRRSRA
jgi:dTDP-4-dehydrorhamnose reductase